MAKRGSIHSDQVCPICGSRFKNSNSKGLPPIPKGLAYPKGLFCPNHMQVIPTKFVVRFENITKRFTSLEAAEDFLTGLNFERRTGQYDPRDYQTRAMPLAFDKLADEWLTLKAGQVRPGALRPLKNAMARATKAWGGKNIKQIKYAQVEDMLTALPLSAKTKKNTLDALKQFWSWVANRYEIDAMKKWPNLGMPEMAFRRTISIPDQEAVLAEIYRITSGSRIRSWIGIKWLCTYISIRPGEMLSLREGDIDRQRGLIIISDKQAKERRPKVIPLLDEDRDILSTLPLAFPDMPFFRHEHNAHGRYAGKKFGTHLFYDDWKQACANLGLEAVDLYGGTKHSTAMGLRDVATFEEVRKMTGHTTNRAFDRYLHLEGENMKNLYARRKPLADNDLITESAKAANAEVLNFTTK